MSGWGEVWLAAIAVSTVVMAVIQVGVVVYAAKLAKRVDRLTDHVEHEVKPLLEQVRAIAANAQQMSALATAQVDRADRLFADLAERVEQSADVVQDLLAAPAREGRAVLAGVRAAFETLRELRRGLRPRGRVEEEDPLFIG